MKPVSIALAALSALTFALASANPAHACLNDRDTLAEEARGLPDVVQVVTGRFERNPPLYYEMRIDRVRKDLAAHPANLSEYNDIAVACDRIGWDDEAIQWMNQKRFEMAGLPHAGVTSEDWYTYWADIGTCRIHRWIRHGADLAAIYEAKRARNEVAEALKIKPDAHFGREKCQLQVMDWMIRTRLDPSGQTELAWQLEAGTDWDRPSIARALCGLVVLGNAWESPDLFNALGRVLSHESTMQIRELCFLRVAELEASGHKPIGTVSDWKSADETSREYTMLRKEADAWQAERTAFMMARLQAGRHPDTDPHFWDGYVDPGPPQLPIPLLRRIDLWGRPYFGFGWFGPWGATVLIFYTAVLLIVVRVIRSGVRRWKARRAA